MPASPGRLLSTAAVWPFGGRVTDEVPMRAPEPSQTVIVTVSVLSEGLAIATAVV
jgi:hypothetical protein